MVNPKLSEGALAVIMSGGTVDEPILQVLGSKKIVGSNTEKERYRLLVSDGKYQISFAMIATQLNERVTSGQLATHCVIKVKRFITSLLNNSSKTERRVLVILDLAVLHPAEEIDRKIGNPTPLADDVSKPTSTPASNGHSSSSPPAAVAPKPPAAAAAAPKPMPTYETSKGQNGDASSSSNQLIVPIANLSPYQNKWMIKARVTNKSSIRTWSNSKGEGKLFSMDLADESGEIRATLFRDLVDKYYAIIEVDKVYYISKCQLKIANRKFCHLNNEYEMTFNSETTLTPCSDDVAIPKTMYNFIPINNIVNQEVGAIIDIIGVCKMMTAVQTIVARSTNRELKKREVTLVDQSASSVVLTLWGQDAENFSDKEDPIVAIRGAKVGEFGGGKNLSVLVSSVFKTNPDMIEAHRLRGWFDNGGKVEKVNDISARSSTGNMRTTWMSIADVKEKKLGATDAEYYQCKASILLANNNNALYKACPTDECNKKVVDLDNGQYRCEKCNTEYASFKYRLIMTCNIGDWSDNQWVSMFATEAEKILKMTSQELGEATEVDKEALVSICNKVNFTEYVFKCRAKMDAYNDEMRLRCVAIRVDSVNYKEYHSYLSTQISEVLKL